MKVRTCFLLFEIFAYTNSVSVMRFKEDHRVISQPQETVKEYSNNELSGDTNSLQNVYNFITKGTTVQDMKLVLRAPRVETVTDFIQEAVKILNTYEDTAFEDFFHVLDSEIRKYHYRGCKFSELTQNSDTRSLLAGSLKLIRGKSASFTKANINEVADMMRDETYDKNVKELLSYINSLYKNTELNFHSVLHELKYYRNSKSVRPHNNLVLVIRNGVRAVLFNPYSELNSNTRRELKKRIETFWKQFKNNPASRAEMNGIPYTDPVVKSVINSSEKIIKEGKNIEPYFKNDPQVKQKNKRERIVSSSTETIGEQSQDDETEKDESNNESGIQITNSNTDEILSGQSFDSSSNSIKNSQERHEEYNIQRYMTLYTEEVSYKTKTTKKIEILPISANVMTRRPKVKKLSTNFSTLGESDVLSDRSEKLEMLRANHDTNDTELNISNSSYDTESGLTLESKQIPKVRANYDTQQKQGKADESKSKSKQKNVEIISDAIIDVQLVNTELLKSLGMFEPLEMKTTYDTTLHSKYAVPTKRVPTKSTIRPRSMRAEAEIRPKKPTAPTNPPSRYSKRNIPRKQSSDLRKNLASPLRKGHPADQFTKDKNQTQKYLRSSDNDTIGAEDFNTYVIKRINAMENKLNKLEQMNEFSFRSRMSDNNSNEVEARNVTDKLEIKDTFDVKRKDMKGNVTVRLLNEDHDLDNDENDFLTRNNTMNTESSTNNTKSHKLNVIKKDATVFDNKNTTQATKINVKVTMKLKKEVINSNVTTSTISLVKVTNETSLGSVVTIPTVGITRKTVTFSEPSYYYDSQQGYRPTVRNSRIDPFNDQINDSDLRM